MGELLAVTIPLALGAAVSPLVFIAQLKTLSGPRPLVRGLALTAGAAMPLLLAGTVVLIFGKAISLSTSPETAARIDLALGLLLLALGVYLLRRPAKPPAVQAGDPRVGRSFALGAVVMVSNASSLALYIPAVKEISASDVDAPDKALAWLIVLAITLLAAELPLALAAISPRRSEPLLEGLGEFMKRHNRAISVGIVFVFGALLVVKGIAGM
jgi:hypothetical protein